MLERRWWHSDAAIVLAVGLGSALLSVALGHLVAEGPDLAQALVAARTMAHGQNPYPLFGYNRGFGSFPLFYPLTASLIVMPLAWLPTAAACAIFVGVSMGLLAAGLLRAGRGRERLWLLLAEPVFTSIAWAQWAPLLTAAFLLPALAWVWAAKPNFALPFLLAKPSRTSFVALALGGGSLLLVTLVVQPGWPFEWLHAIDSAALIRPLLLSPFGGFLLALALLRWRDPDARLLFGLACTPQTLWTYNALPALLVARGRQQMWTLVVLSWLASAVQNEALARVPGNRPKWEAAVAVMLWLFYLPTLGLVLRRSAGGRRVRQIQEARG